MDAAEQRWRAGEFVPTNRDSYGDNETTLTLNQNDLSETLTNQSVTPDPNVSLSETLTDQNAGGINVTFTVSADDSGIDGNDSKEDSKLYHSIEDDVKTEELLKDNEKEVDKEVVKEVEEGKVEKVNETGDGDEVFEDCVDDDAGLKPGFDRVSEKYSLEMKLALGIEGEE